MDDATTLPKQTAASGFAAAISGKRKFRVLAALAFAVLAVVALLVWRNAERWTSTDNAYVEADTAIVGSQIDGYVAEVLVVDNQQVKKGDALVTLDRADYVTQLDQARAALAGARASYRNVSAQRSLENSQVDQRAAAVRRAQAEAEVAQADLERYRLLSREGFVATQRLQAASAGAKQASAGVAEATAALTAQRRSVGAYASAEARAGASIKEAEARVAAAELALERTVIRAPVDGVVGARSARPGQYVRPGMQLMAVVPLGDTYVVANFKETQVAKLRVGQTVRLEADAFPGRHIEGRIDSFSPASGSEFALIPVEHANGNFTKITQRVPVKIALTDSAVASGLRPGLSVVAKVDTHSKGGASFTEGAARQAHADAAP